MAAFLHYAALALLCVATAIPRLVPIVAPALIRRTDARTAKRARQSAPSPVDSKESTR